MATYTAITSGQIDQDSPINQPLMSALAYNVEAYMETASSAPIGAYAWQIEDGTGGTDPIYDHSVDGTVAQIETPVFDAGWEYALVGEGISINDAGNLELAAYRTAASSYSGFVGLAAYTNGAERFSFFAHLVFPMWNQATHFVNVMSAQDTGNAGTASSSVGSFYYSGGTTISKAKLDTSGIAANIDAGKVYLLKRAEYGGR